MKKLPWGLRWWDIVIPLSFFVFMVWFAWDDLMLWMSGG